MMFEEELGQDGKYMVPQRRAEPTTRKIPRLRPEPASESPTRQPVQAVNTGDLVRNAEELSSEVHTQWGPYGGRQEQPAGTSTTVFSATAAPFYGGRKPIASMPTYDPVWSGPMIHAPTPSPVKTGNPYNPGSGLQPPVNPSSYPSLEQLQMRLEASALPSPYRYPPDIQRALDRRGLRFETPREAKDPRQFICFDENMKPKEKQQPDMYHLNGMRPDAASQERFNVNQRMMTGLKFSTDLREDEELSVENNIPYRLRPPPLTGPRYIR